LLNFSAVNLAVKQLMIQTAMPVAEKLDPFTAYLPYKLYRESTRYVDGKVVKVSFSTSPPLGETRFS
jgi:hypothetical protein